jgi:protein SCO1/2
MSTDPMPGNKPKPAGQTPTPRDATRKFLLPIVGFLMAVLVLGAGAMMFLGGSLPDGPVVGGTFSLLDGDGKRVTDRDLRGAYLLVYFGYTFCPDICPTTLNQIAEALDILGPKGKNLRPVFITVDPGRDTPGVMKQYAASFTPRLLPLTGSDAEIADVARKFRVYYAPHRTGDKPGDYTMDHSSVLYLMDPQGKFVAPLRADAPAAELAANLSKQLK